MSNEEINKSLTDYNCIIQDEPKMNIPMYITTDGRFCILSDYIMHFQLVMNCNELRALEDYNYIRINSTLEQTYVCFNQTRPTKQQLYAIDKFQKFLIKNGIYNLSIMDFKGLCPITLNLLQDSVLDNIDFIYRISNQFSDILKR